LHLRFDRQKIFYRYGKDWGNHQIQLNREAVTKNKRNPNTSIVAVILEGKFTYPKDVMNTAFKESLKRGRQVYVTVNVKFLSDSQVKQLIFDVIHIKL
jgi:hypothetical protein